MAYANHFGQKTFDRSMDNIAPCPSAGQGFEPMENVYHSIRLHLTHGFMWGTENWGLIPLVDGEVVPTGYGDNDIPYLCV